jgi:hypothetical protein
LCDLEDLAVGIPFILGLVIYMAIILGLTLWLSQYHSLKSRRTATDQTAEIAENESQTTDPKPGNVKY